MAVERLGIPAIKMTDGPNGVRGAHDSMGPRSVCTTVRVALAATWNPDPVQEVGALLGREIKRKGAHILLAPTVNIHRSPLAGRNFECYSEDPYITGRLAVAYIQGVQSQGVGACIKHFVCNDSEYERMSISSEIEMVAGRPYALTVEYRSKATVDWLPLQIRCMLTIAANSIDKAAALAAQSDAAIVFAGLTNEWESEGFDRPDM